MEWKSLSEFPGMYEISKCGKVKSLRGKTPIIMKTHVINSGYESVTLKIKGVSHNRLVHRLVAQEFCEGYEPHLDVSHIDANRTNNVYTNLEWVTRKENIQDAIRRGTFDIKSAHAVAHEKRKRPVRQYTKDGEFVAEYESAREAGDVVGIHENCISRVCRGERKYTANHKFVYV